MVAARRVLPRGQPLGHAAAELDRASIELLVEPINPFDIPGFHIVTTAQALATALVV